MASLMSLRGSDAQASGWLRARTTGVALIAALASASMAVGTQEASAAPCSNALVREQQAATHLPDCRAYELVSPTDKASEDVRHSFSELRSSDSGAGVTYTAAGSFPGTGEKGAPWRPRYLARRGSGGWVSRAIDSKQDPQYLNILSLGSMYNNLQPPESFTPDLAVSVDQDYQVQLDPAHVPDPGVAPLYRRAYASDTYQMISTAPAPLMPALIAGFPLFLGASSDMEHILFQDLQAHTSDPVTPFQLNLYEWDHGTVRLVGLLPADEGGGVPSGGSVGAAGPIDQGIGHHDQTRGAQANVISTDGSRIFFLDSNVNTGNLYVREDGGTASARTIRVSQSEKTTPDPSPQPVSFWGATPSGSKALFISPEQLVDTDGDTSADLYAADVDAPAGSRLTRLSEGAAPADALAVLGTSTDQSSGYFVASGQLTADAPAGTEPKIYRWSSGAGLRFVAQLAPGTADVANWDPAQNTGMKSSRVTPDGRYLLFDSTAQITTYNNAGHDEFYLFDASSPGAGVTCVSCRKDGSAPTGDATVQYINHNSFATAYQPRLLVPHGNSVDVFFDTSDQLDPNDGNARLDAYMYDGDTGKTSLLSSGADAEDSYFLDASASGDDVFIATRARLSGWDRDPLYDIYDVRVDGGSPEPASNRPCEGDDCRAAAGRPPAADDVGTASYHGPGNEQHAAPAGKPAAPAKVRVVGKKGQGSVIVLRVKVPGTGRLVVTGSTVVRATRRTSRAATYTMRVKLGSSARRRLARSRTLRSVLRVGFVTDKGNRSTDRVTVVLKRIAKGQR